MKKDENKYTDVFILCSLCIEERYHIMRFNVDLDDEMHKELMAYAKSQGGRTASDVVRMLIYEWLQQRKKDELQMIKLTHLNGEHDAR